MEAETTSLGKELLSPQAVREELRRTRLRIGNTTDQLCNVSSAEDHTSWLTAHFGTRMPRLRKKLHAEIAFTAQLEDFAGWAHEEPLMGVIYSGATSTLGSAEALEEVMRANLDKDGKTHMDINTELRPIFKFGNGAKRQSISTVTMKMEAGEKTGVMEVHVISRKSFKALGAVLDFEEDKIIYKRVDPRVVVDLEEAANGHLLMPLTGNLLERGRSRDTPFQSLSAE